ncbi:MAG: hypothetical protein R3E50_09425 [Halioglobus sp.]
MPRTSDSFDKEVFWRICNARYTRVMMVAGAIGVIVTPLYLSVQLRVSNVAAKVEAKLAAAARYTDFFRTLIEDPEINDVFVRWRVDMEQLNSEEF